MPLLFSAVRRYKAFSSFIIPALIEDGYQSENQWVAVGSPYATLPALDAEGLQ